MVRTKFGLDYLDGPTIERLGLVIPALGLKQEREVVVVGCNVGMILAERLFADLDGPPIERLGLVILALRLEADRRGCCTGSQRRDDPCRDAFSPISMARRKSGSAWSYLPWACSRLAEVVVVESQRRDDPCREPFHRSRWPGDRAARPRHTCPGPEAEWRGCCSGLQRRMILAESLFTDLDRPTKERLGLAVARE